MNLYGHILTWTGFVIFIFLDVFNFYTKNELYCAEDSEWADCKHEWVWMFIALAKAILVTPFYIFMIMCIKELIDKEEHTKF